MDQAITIPKLISRYILLNDIVASSRLMEEYPFEFNELLDRHNQLFLTTAGDFGGEIFKNTGDGYYVFFESFNECVAYANELAKQFAEFPTFGLGEKFQVGIAIHAGEIRPSVTQYFGPALNRASRLCAICHPGQILISGNAVPRDPKLPEGLMLSDLGSHHLRDLGQPEHLYQLNSLGLAQTEFPALETLNNRPNNLFRQPNAFFGREAELAELTGLLDGHPLVSIIAPGGYGKSRLAAHLCADLLPDFGHGVFLVELASVRDHKGITTAIANATGFHFFGKNEPAQQVIDFLRNKEMLLCLDNFEHVLEGAPLIGDILKEASKVKVIVTSREPLQITGEQKYPLEPLPVEGPLQTDKWDMGAVILFADRASLVNPAFTLDVNNIPDVYTICQRLDGIPLAIELAAAWMDNFSLGELLAELDQQLELTARLTDLPERHLSLRASLDWSWNMLSEEQQHTLMRIATFRGGCFPDAASAVLQLKGMKLRGGLAKLVDKSWLYTRDVNGTTRYYLRDAASREYSFEKLEETRECAGNIYEQAVMAHAWYFSEQVAREGPRLAGDGTPTGQLEALATFEVEFGNITEAVDSLLHRVSSPPDPGAGQSSSSCTEPDASNTDVSPTNHESLLLPLVRWVMPFLDTKGKFKEFYELYQSIYHSLPETTSLELRGWATAGLCLACWQQGHREKAIELNSSVLALSRDGSLPRLEAWSLNRTGILARGGGRMDQAQECYRQSLVISRELGDLGNEARSLSNLGQLLMERGLIDEARKCFKQALAIQCELGDRRGEGVTLSALGILERNLGMLDTAREYYELSLAISRELGHRLLESNNVGNLGILFLDQGMYEKARDWLEQSMKIDYEIGDRMGEAYTLDSYAGLLLKTGELGNAIEVFQRCQEIGEELKLKHVLAAMNAKWARYWLQKYEQSTSTEAGATFTPPTPQAAIEKALEHLAIAEGYKQEMGGTGETEEGHEITIARRAVIKFAEVHSLADGIADLIAVQQAEDAVQTDCYATDSQGDNSP